MNGLGLRVLGGNISITLGRQIGASLLQFITLILIAQVYGPEGNGVYAVTLLLPATLATLLNLGIAPANVYFLGSGKISPQRALSSTLQLFACIAVTGLIIGGLVAQLFGEIWFPGIPKILLGFALLIFPVSLLLSFVSSIFQGLQKFREFNIVLLLQPFCNLVIIVGVLLTGLENIGWLIFAYLASTFFTLSLAFLNLKPYLSQKIVSNLKGYNKAVLSYGYKAHLSNILTFINYKADIFFVNFFLGPVYAGVYVIAVQLSEKLWLFSQAVSTVLLPRLSQLSKDEEKRKKITPLITRWVLWLTLLGAMLLSLIAYPLIKIFFGEVFTGSFVPLIYLMPGIVAGSASRIIANDLAARGRPELNMYTSLISVPANITGNILLIPHYGLIGAAVVTSISYIIILILLFVMYYRLVGTSILDNILLQRDDLNYFRKFVYK